jgi:hypothetical protein
MDSNDQRPSALGLVWLTGGLVAVSEPQEREVRIMTLGTRGARFLTRNMILRLASKRTRKLNQS